MIPLSVVVLTKNEETRIARCLASVAGWADDLVIVDGLSTDSTVEICRRHGARVISRPFSGSFGEERNVGAEAAKHDWVLQLDGDDVVSDELRHAIERMLREGAPHAAFQVRRKNNFLGRWMMRGGWYHYYQTLYRRSRCHFEGRVHHILKIEGTVGTLEAPVLHYPFENLEQFLAKQNRYTELEARELLDEQGAPSEALLRRQLRRRPRTLFWKLYVKKQGWREGWHGLVFCGLYAGVHVLKWAKYWERAFGAPQSDASLTRFIERQNQETSAQARRMWQEQGRLPAYRLLRELAWRPFALFRKEGRPEGWEGFIRSWLAAWVHFLAWAKYWDVWRQAR